MEKLKIENLTFTYPKENIPALKNINLSVNPGEFVVLCGSSGSGKSTLLRHIKPRISPHGDTEGKIFFDGIDITALSEREQAEKIGFVGQNPNNQIVCDKVWHELAFGLENMALPSNEIRVRTAETAAFFGIGEWFFKKTCELSGGQKQLLNLASVMCMKPSLLVLDEPTSCLDPIAAHDFLNDVSRINKELGITVILSEHRTEEVFPMADRVIVLDGGEIISDKTPRQTGAAFKTNLSFLPTPMRIYYETEQDGDAPLTVREGREWLAEKDFKRDIVFEDTENPKGELAAELDEVWFRYEKNSPDILKGLSTKIYKNEIYAIVGGNGAGKTTALSVISKINKPYRGKLVLNGKTAAVPQNPEMLFSQKSVLKELEAVEADSIKRKQAIDICELGGLLNRHPYDLSGGEKQRLALAVVLLRKPDILILDEPTKGLDMRFKQKFASVLTNLKNSGIAVIMVSHDIEFCVKYADRCAMLFDGAIVAEDTPRRLFSNNSFYTTAACRMANGILPGAVLDSDITAALGKEKIKEVHVKKDFTESSEIVEEKKTIDKKKNIPLGILFFALFCAVQFFLCGRYNDYRDSIFNCMTLIFLGLSCTNFVPHKKSEALTPNKRKTSLTAFLPILLIPLTIFAGVRYFDDKKYYFISICIILETLLPYIFMFEKRKPTTREIVTVSVLCALAVCGRAAFAPFPQFKPAAAVIIVTGVCFGGETGFLTGAMCGFVSNFFFSQGPWTPWQMLAFGLVGFLAGEIFGIMKATKIRLAVFGFFAVFALYGPVMNIASAVMMYRNPTAEQFITCFLSGLSFDIVHAVSTVVFLWLGAEPICEKIERIKLKYGFV